MAPLMKLLGVTVSAAALSVAACSSMASDQMSSADMPSATTTSTSLSANDTAIGRDTNVVSGSALNRMPSASATDGAVPEPVDQSTSARTSGQASNAQVAMPALQSMVGGPDADMQKVLTKLASLGGKPIETLAPADARKQPTPADAVKAVMKDGGITATSTVTTKDVTYPAGVGTQKARIYMPANASEPLPVVLYIHGGGWVIADIDVYDATPRAMAEQANAIVVSMEYRHAPEAKFPAAHDDANAAYKWILDSASKWGGDPERVAVMGESAGGNMAINVAINARDKGWTKPASIVSVYPVANTSKDLPAKKVNANAKPLNTPMLDWFFNHTLTSPDQAKDKRLNLVAANLSGLPPTTIILAEIDPLHDDGVTLAQAMEKAGGKVIMKEYKGVTHEFFGMSSIVSDAKDAQAFVAEQIKQAFAAQAS